MSTAVRALSGTVAKDVLVATDFSPCAESALPTPSQQQTPITTVPNLRRRHYAGSTTEGITG